MENKFKNKEFVYTLKLEKGKYYVGYSRNIGKRISEHMSGTGAKWTLKYRPLMVLHVQEGNEDLEYAQTILMMNLYGWENVRGSTYSSLDIKSIPDILQVYPPSNKLEFDIKVVN